MPTRKKQKMIWIFGIALLICLLVIVTILFFSDKPPQPPQRVSSIADLESYLNTLVTGGDPPGLNLVVIEDGKVVYEGAFGMADGPRRMPATPDTIYHWWSTTKMFTATAVFQLQEQGLLDIEDPVVKYVPFFQVKYPSSSSRSVTIKDLLNHSSGLPDNVPAVIGWMHLENQPQLDQTALLEKVLPDYAALKFEPGIKAQYTNVGYMVLGAVIEKVSGQSYENYVVDHILHPLKMERTNFIYNDAMLPYAAAGAHPLLDIQSALLPFIYGRRLPGFIREIEGGRIWFNRFYADSDPPTGLIGPAGDLARFVAAHMNGGELDGQRILSEKSVATMMHAGYISKGNPSDPSDVQGLGWDICGEGEDLCLQRSGGGPGFGSAIRLYPERGLGIVLTANSTNIDREAILGLAASLDWE